MLVAQLLFPGLNAQPTPTPDRQLLGGAGGVVIPPRSVSAVGTRVVRMRSGDFIPAGSLAANLARIRSADAAPEARVLLQFGAIPDKKVRQALADGGVQLLTYVPQHAWFAVLPSHVRADLLLNAGVVWVGSVYPGDKLPERLRLGNPGIWAVRDDGSVAVILRWFPDGNAETLAGVVTSVGGRVYPGEGGDRYLRADIPRAAINTVVADPRVRWMEEVPPPRQASNNSSRANTQADLVQAAPYNLTGAGVAIGIWDGGPVDAAHPDFAGRITIVDSANPTDDHATHVAGIVGGSGANSATHGGTANQWKGAAPGSTLVSYDFQDDTVGEHQDAIALFGVSVSNNSWGYQVEETPLNNCSVYGDYGFEAAGYDALALGGLGAPVTVVFSAGNERSDGDCGMTGGAPDYVNYGNVKPPATAKNILTVGAINSDDSSMTSFSSWGPTDDGRIKPDLVAPGDQVGVDGGVTSTLPGGGYGVFVGTSMAAPAVSGAVALLTQEYRASHGSYTPEPAIIRALLLHTAQDLDDATAHFNKGPDYASGYGRVQVKGAIDQLRAGGLVLGSVAEDGLQTYTVTVAPGTGFVKFTLVWDDPPAAENASVTLVNDLDLVVTDPNGVRRFPWTLNPSVPAQAAIQTAEDHVNVVEQVLVDSGVTPGVWTISVRGHALGSGLLQPYALVMSPASGVPSIQIIPDQTLRPGGTVSVPVVLIDPDTASGSLVLSASSSNPVLLPTQTIGISGTGPQRALQLTPAPGLTGKSEITVTVSDGANTATTRFMLNVSSDQSFTNNAAIPIPSSGGATPYPSIITVPAGTYPSLLGVAVDLVGFSHDYPDDVFVLLTSPAGAKVLLMAAVGGSHAVSGLTLQIDDAATASMPGSAELSTGFFKPSDDDSGDTALGAGAPGLPYSATLAAVTNSSPAGNWGLYIYDSASGDAGSVSGGWRLRLRFANSGPTISDVVNRSVQEDQAAGPIPVVIGDAETPAGNLVLNATSSNTQLVPNAAITLGGSGANRTLTVVPAPNLSGSTVITLTVTDGDLSASDTFTLTVDPINDPPTVTPPGSVTLIANQASGPLNFTVGDVETAAPNLTVTANSSNLTLLPLAGITLGGSGASRTVTLQPAPNQTGTATVTLNVSDGTTSASAPFLLTVNPDPNPPTISDIVNRTIQEDQVAGPIGFTVGDANSPAASLVVTGTSSNTGLLPLAGIVFGGSGASRTLTLTPLANQSGVTTVTVTVSDGVLTASDSFLLTVNPVNDAPVLSGLANLGGLVNTPLVALFSLSDIDTGFPQLTLTARSLAPSIVPENGFLFVGTGTERLLVITPVPGAVGPVGIEVVAGDGALFTTNSFTATFVATSTPPTISDIQDRSTPEDSPLVAVPFTVGDAQTLAEELVVTVTTSNPGLVGPGGVFVDGTGANRTLTLIPAPNAFGAATMTVTVTDGHGMTATDTFTFTVESVNDAPRLGTLPDLSMAEDSSITLPVSIGDEETTATALVLTVSSGNTAVIAPAGVVVSGTGSARTLQLTPVANANGVVPVQVSVSDGALTTTRTFNVTVNAVNDPATISAVSDLVMTEDVPTVVAFTIGDVETAAGSLVVKAYTSNPSLIPGGPANLTLGGSGTARTLTITPALNIHSGLVGQSTLYIEVTDGQGLAVLESFLVTVLSVNDAPAPIPFTDITLAEDTGTTVPFTVSDAETAAANLVVTATSSNPALIPDANLILGGAGSSRSLSITPLANRFGPAQVVVRVSDGVLATDSILNIQVTAVNDLPTISSIATQTILEDTQTSALPFVVGDVETATTDLVVTAQSSNASLLPVRNIFLAGTGPNRSVVLVPVKDGFGTSTVTLTVSDGAGSSTTSFQLNVTGTPEVPVISAIPNQSTPEDVPVTVSFTIGDAETPAANLTVQRFTSNYQLVPPSGANLVLGGSGANRTLTVIPAPNANTPTFGVSTITLVITDADGQTATTSFQLTVTAVNDPPTITPVRDQVLPEDTASPALAFTVADTETSAAGLVLSAASSNTGLLPVSGITFAGVAGSPTVQFTPAPNQSGSSQVTLTVQDAGGATATTVLTVTVTPVNDAPVISAIADLTIEEDTATPDLPFTVSDAETAAGSLALAISSSNIALIPHDRVVVTGTGSSRTVRVTPLADRSGSAVIGLSLSDGSLTSTEFFQVTVTPVNDPPTVGTIANISFPEDTLSPVIPLTVGDAETQPAALVVTATSSNPSLIPATGIFIAGSGGQRSLLLLPALNANSPAQGTATITVSVNDGSATRSISFVATVTAVNDPPVINAIANRVIQEDQVAGPFLVVISDVETPTGSLVLSATSSNPALVPPANVTFGVSGGSRTATVTPLPDQNGITTITISVSDGVASADRSFTLTVNAVNDAPTISNIANQATAQNTPIIIPFTVGDKETAAGSLSVSRFTSNTGLIPHTAESMTLGGSGANRTLTLTPVPGQTGSSLITVVVSDGVLTAEDQFTLTVGAGGASLARAGGTNSAGARKSAAPWLQGLLQREGRWGVELLTTVGTRYSLEGTADPASGDWQAVAETLGDGGLQFLADPGNSEPMRFYRVRVD